MSKNERKRTMVYSNVNKKADSKSASSNDNHIDLDNEIVIGLASFPKPNVAEPKKKKKGQINKLDNSKDKKNVKLDEETIEYSNEDEVEIPKMTKQEKIMLQKRRVIKKMGVIMLLFVLLIGGIVYFFLSPAANVKKIDVKNNSKISSAEIISTSSISMNKNMFKFSKKEVEKKLLKNPYIEDVNISRNVFLNKVTIDVKERKATLMLEYGNSYVYIDNQGYILEISTIKIDSPIIKGYVTPLEDVKPGNRLNKDDLERLEVVLNIIKNASINGIDKLITHISIKDKNNYTIFLESEGKTVYLGTCTDLSTQMLYIKEMLDWEKGIEGEYFVDMDLNKSYPVFREKV